MTVITDPFALLEEAAQKQVAGNALLDRIGKARRKLVFDSNADAAFWATLALRLKVSADWSIDTLATDGTRLICNPEYIAKLPDDQVIGVIAHEVSHCANAHHARIGERDPALANVACDLAINPLLENAGFKLPPGRLMPGEGPYKKIPPDLSMEAIYPLLLDKKGKEPKGGKDGDEDGDGQGQDPGGCGSVQKPGDGSEAAQAQQKAEWEVAVAQAAQVAKQRGKLSAGLERLIGEVLEPKVDWRQVLREFITKMAKTEYRWTPPNRRFAWQGIYLPGRSGESLGHLVFSSDESGSVSDEQMQITGGELDGIMSAYDDVTLTIIHHADQVHCVETWTKEDGPFVLQRKCSGGTSHVPVFQWVSDNDIAPSCMVCLTDLESEFPDQPPPYPVLWASIQKNKTGPFGRTVYVDAT